MYLIALHALSRIVEVARQPYYVLMPILFALNTYTLFMGSYVIY